MANGFRDPAAAALQARLEEIARLTARGDPAFQPGSAFMRRQGLPTSKGFDFDEQTLLDAILGSLGSGRGGLGSGPAFAETEAGLRLTSQLAREELGQRLGFEREALRQRFGFEAAESEKQRAFERQLEKERQRIEAAKERQRLLHERQAKFAELYGKDPVRAVLFGLGLGGELVPGAGKFAGLPKLAGIGRAEQKTERALGATLGRRVDIGRGGVKGLGTAEQAARAFQFGGEAPRTLLTSAFGVGEESLGGGLSGEEFVRRVQEVTPTGIL